MNDKQIESLDFNGWPQPDSVLVEIGRISCLWISLESTLNLVLAKLAKYDDLYDPTPLIIFSHASFPQRLDIFAALCDQLAGSYPQLRDYPSVVAAMKSAQTSRNRFIHNPIGVDPKTGEFQMAQGSARGKLKTSITPISIADLRKASIAINEAQRVLYKLIFKRDIPPIWEIRGSKK